MYFNCREFIQLLSHQFVRAQYFSEFSLVMDPYIVVWNKNFSILSFMDLHIYPLPVMRLRDQFS
jgi:hypothetical protein